MSTPDPPKLRVGISACLLGQEVRYNGGHKREVAVSPSGTRVPVPLPELRTLRVRIAKTHHTGRKPVAGGLDEVRIPGLRVNEWLRLPKTGVKNLLVLCPAFVADCLETLEEIAMQGRDSFLAAGGVKFQQIPCPNDHPAYIDFLANRARRWLSPAHS